MKILDAMFMCHKLPERSFFYKGKQFPICARCTGILVGYFIGIIIIITYNREIVLGLLLMLPLAIDGGGQYINLWISNNRRRFITGILAGISTDIILYNIMVLGFRHGRYIAHILKNLIGG